MLCLRAASVQQAVIGALALAGFSTTLQAGEKPRTSDKPSTTAPLVIVLGGDLGLGGSGQPVSPHGGYRHGSLKPWHQLTSGIAPLIKGDINFANLETVVTDSNKLKPAAKAFNFRMHSNGLKHLVKVGFNVLSTANNHAIDYGHTGMRHTLKHAARLKSAGLKAAPGVGIGRSAAARPAIVQTKGYKVAISALGIGGAGVRSEKYIGQLSYRSKADFAEAVQALKGSAADYRILSVHYGQELQVRPAPSAVVKLRDQAARDGNVDIVVGHHAHVAAGVQLVDGKLVFYGMGNLLHLGMQDMAKFGHCRDFGLLARVHVARGKSGGRARARAVEVIPLTNMHNGARAMQPPAATKRIAVLNTLARELDDPATAARGLRFSAQPDGTGLYCMKGAENMPGRIGALCTGWLQRVAKAGQPKSRKIVCGYRRKRLVRRDATARSRPRARRNGKVRRSDFARNFFREAHGG